MSSYDVASNIYQALDVGKSSLCKILCNYAVRKGWSPLFVDLDLGQVGPLPPPAPPSPLPSYPVLGPCPVRAPLKALPLV
jgi:hypothetical protein